LPACREKQHATQIVFSERELTFTFAICHRNFVCLSVVCRLSVVRIVGAEQVIRVLSKTLTQVLKRNSCWNNIHEKIFGYFKWELVKEIQLFYQRLDFIHVVDKCKFSFFNQLCMNCFNGTLHECFFFFKRSIAARKLYTKYDAIIGDFISYSAVFYDFNNCVLGN